MEKDMTNAAETQKTDDLSAITIHVNNHEVRLEGHRQTGLQIKQAAVAQGVDIKVDFVLFDEVGNDRTKHIADDEAVQVNAESRFLADVDILTVHVNEHPVRLEGRRHSGLQIKEAAIKQGVRIQPDFVLLEELPHNRTKEIKDDEFVVVSDKTRFQAIPNDDHS